MLARIERKLAQVQRWVDSVYGPGDVPAAVALSIYRTRPPAAARPIWVRPAPLGGYAVRVNAAAMSDFVIYEEVFMEGIYDLNKVAFVPDAIIDAGAYHGYFSLLAAARFPGVAIIAFEPNVLNLDTLLANVSHNSVRVEVCASAVSTRDGSATFAGGGCGGHLAEAGTVEVVVTSLSRVIHERACERLLLKLDIEGEEAAVLPGVLPYLPTRTAIFFEWHLGRHAYEQVATLLAAHGFAVTVTRENRLETGAVYIDAFAQR